MSYIRQMVFCMFVRHLFVCNTQGTAPRFWNGEHSCFEGEFNMNMHGSSASGGGHFRDSCMPAFSRLCGHPSATSCFFFRTFLCGAILCGNVTSEHKATQIAARTQWEVKVSLPVRPVWNSPVILSCFRWTRMSGVRRVELNSPKETTVRSTCGILWGRGEVWA